MKRIFKYELEVVASQVLSIPRLERNVVNRFSDQVLKVDTQKGKPCMWVIVDDELPEEERRVYTKGTGHVCDEFNMRDYLGSYQLDNGNFVRHIFGY